MKILSALKFTSARELHAFIPELSTEINLHRHSSSEALSLSLPRPQFLTWENSHQTVCCVVFLCSLWALVLYFYSFKLTSFILYLSFSSVVPSLEHRHSLCSKTELVKATPDQKFASISCAAKTGLVPQHLIKTTRWLSSELWKIALERLAPGQK